MEEWDLGLSPALYQVQPPSLLPPAAAELRGHPGSMCRQEQTLCEEYGNRSTESNLGHNPECSISVIPVINQEKAGEYSWESHIYKYSKQQEQQLAPQKILLV